MNFFIELDGVEVVCTGKEIMEESNVGIPHCFDVKKVYYKGKDVTEFAIAVFSADYIEEKMYEYFERTL